MNNLPGMKGIYLKIDKDGRVPVTCNCKSCIKQRKEWGEEEPKMESVSIADKIQELVKYNFNTILVSDNTGSQQVSTNPLNILIDEAHKNNIKVHLVTELGNIAPPKPEWQMTNAEGERVPYVDPGNPELRKFLINKAVDFLKDYDLDGINLDFIRYAEIELSGDCCYCDICRENFKKKYNFDPIEIKLSNKADKKREQSVLSGQLLWNKERSNNITTFVKDLKSAMLEVRNDAALSAYIWGPASRLVFQDAWPEWLRDGYLDWINPSGYDYDPNLFKHRCIETEVLVDKNAPFCITLGPHTTHGRMKNVEELIEQINIAQKFGSNGYILFTHSHKVLSSYLPYL